MHIFKVKNRDNAVDLRNHELLALQKFSQMHTHYQAIPKVKPIRFLFNVIVFLKNSYFSHIVVFIPRIFYNVHDQSHDHELYSTCTFII